MTTSVLGGQRKQFLRVLGAAEVGLGEVAEVVLVFSNQLRDRSILRGGHDLPSSGSTLTMT